MAVPLITAIIDPKIKINMDRPILVIPLIFKLFSDSKYEKNTSENKLDTPNNQTSQISFCKDASFVTIKDVTKTTMVLIIVSHIFKEIA
jgi:hypothetical protein